MYLLNNLIMEKERTIHNLLGEEIYRITKEQITKLIELITSEIKSNTLKGISGVLDNRGNYLLQHGAFKGRFDDGTNRRSHAEKAFKKANISQHQAETIPDKSYALA